MTETIDKTKSNEMFSVYIKILNTLVSILKAHGDDHFISKNISGSHLNNALLHPFKYDISH